MAIYVSQLPITMEMGAQFTAVGPMTDLVTALAVRYMHVCTRWDDVNLPQPHNMSSHSRVKRRHSVQELLRSDTKYAIETEEKRGNQP